MYSIFLGLYGLIFFIDCILSFFLSKKSLASHGCLHFLIIIAMFITGSVWVYRTSPDLQVLVEKNYWFNIRHFVGNYGRVQELLQPRCVLSCLCDHHHSKFFSMFIHLLLLLHSPYIKPGFCTWVCHLLYIWTDYEVKYTYPLKQCHKLTPLIPISRLKYPR